MGDAAPRDSSTARARLASASARSIAEHGAPPPARTGRGQCSSRFTAAARAPAQPWQPSKGETRCATESVPHALTAAHSPSACSTWLLPASHCTARLPQVSLSPAPTSHAADACTGARGRSPPPVDLHTALIDSEPAATASRTAESAVKAAEPERLPVVGTDTAAPGPRCPLTFPAGLTLTSGAVGK